jgi:diacylglycerol kinase (ATP)
MINGRKVLRSFRFAGRGIVDLFRYENNAKVHLLIAGLVIPVGLWLRLTRVEWAVVLTQIGLVWAAEAINTALEKLCDFVSPGLHPQIKAIKDMASGAVLILSIGAVVVGVIVLGGKAIEVFRVGP